MAVRTDKLRDGYDTFFYPFEGRLAHLGLATLFSYRLSRASREASA